MKTNKKSLLFCCILLLTSIGCIKNYSTINNEELIFNKFFSDNNISNADVKSISTEIKRRAKNEGFLEKFIQRNGYILWNSCKTVKNNVELISIFPIALESKNECNAILIVTKDIKNEIYKFDLFNKNNLNDYGYDRSSKKLNAFNVISIINNFNYELFKTNLFVPENLNQIPKYFKDKFPNKIILQYFKYKSNFQPIVRASQNADLYNQTCITFWDSQDWYLDPDYNLDPNHSNGNESYAYTVLTFTYACVGENYRGIGFGGSDLSASDNINSGTTANSNSILLMYQFDYKIVDSLPQCVKDILTTIKNLSPGKIASIINKFSDTIPTWNWKVIDSSLNINQYGNTSNVVNNNTVVTALDFNKLKTATDISVARTIIHEAVHAYLVMYFKNDPINAIKDYKGITDAWRKSKHPSLNKIQHDEMEKTFVSDIAKELELFGVAMGYNLDSTIYSDLAWGGLDFMNNSTLSDDDKTRIDNRLSVELTNTIINDINPVGKKLKCN